MVLQRLTDGAVDGWCEKATPGGRPWSTWVDPPALPMLQREPKSVLYAPSLLKR